MSGKVAREARRMRRAIKRFSRKRKSSLVPNVREGGALTVFDALRVKARKILQHDFDQDAVDGLVWCGNMN